MTIYDRGVIGLVADLRNTLDEFTTVLTDEETDEDIRGIDIHLDADHDDFLAALVEVARKHGARDESGVTLNITPIARNFAHDAEHQGGRADE